MDDYHHGERMSGDRMSRVSERTIKSEEASQRTSDPPHLGKVDGSGKEYASHRNGRRSVTFSQKGGARMSYFSAQEPWLRETFSASRSREEDEESSRKTHCTGDSSSAIKRTSEHSEQLQCEDTMPSEEKPIELSLHDNERDEQKNQESSEDETDMNMNESRNDPAQTTQLSIASDTENCAGSFYRPPSNLHDICYNALAPSDLFAFYESLSFSQSGTALKDLSRAASQLDSRGRTPLHILSENSALSDTTFSIDDDAFPGLEPSPSSVKDEKQVKTFVLDLLLAANPMAMKQKDAKGLIPFERVFIEWVHRMHNVDSPKHHQRWGLNSRGFSSYSQLSAPSKIQHMWNNTSSHVTNAISWAGKSLPFKGDSLRSMDEERSPKKSNRRGLLNDSGNVDDELERFSDDGWALDHFPSHVHLTHQVKFAITMVSTILDHFDEHVFSRSFRRKALLNYCHSNERLSNGSDFKYDFFHVEMDDLLNSCFAEPSDKIAADVIDEIAAIPYLVKTFLLLTDDDEREWVFSTAFFQRVAMNKNSIGPWLTGMLQSSKKEVQKRGLGYLGYLSHTLEAHSDGWGVQKQKSSSHLGRSSGAHDELHEKLSDLEGFIPSLLTLDQRGIEEAATTLVVRKILDRMISRPFAVSVILLDAVFLTLLIIAFRAAVSTFLTGGSAGTVLSWIYVSNSCTFYFIIRELGSVITILERHVKARIYFLSFWNLTDMLSIILALASTVAIRVKFKQDDIDYSNLAQLRACLAVTTGLLWLRVLSLLKSINMQLATFVLAIFQITRDIMWFLLILSTLVIAFAQMFYSMLVPPECAYNESPPDGLGCKSAEYYLKTYSILLGDFGQFDRDNFETAFSVLLVVAFSFMVVIVLLNVLIAIVSDSYEKCLLRSKSLFGRARVMLIAELGSFQHLLQTDSRNLVEPLESSYSQWWHWCFGLRVQRYSRTSMIFYFLSGLIVFIWFVSETAGFFTGKRVGNYAFSLCSILVNVFLFLGVVALLSNGASSSHEKNAQRVIRRGCFGFIWRWYHDVVQKAMLRLLGSDRESSSFFKKNGEPDEWSGRAHFLSQEMTRLAEESTAQMKEHAKAMEQSVNLSETRLRSEVSTAEEKITGLKGEILNELRQSEERMQEVMLNFMTDLLQALVGEEEVPE